MFQLQEELETPLFADGHVVSIYWENISRSIVERTHRDAKKLDVPLYCLQARIIDIVLAKKAENYQLMLRNLMVTLQEYLVLMNDDIERGAQKSLELVDREAGHKDDHMICICLLYTSDAADE